MKKTEGNCEIDRNGITMPSGPYEGQRMATVSDWCFTHKRVLHTDVKCPEGVKHGRSDRYQA